ncbi:MAG: hypothetical protein L6311_10765, partial [Cellulomonas sp.]|nr:hypothetical protein [Cellulomonas sp.]
MSFGRWTSGPVPPRRLAHAAVLVTLAATTVASGLALSGGPLAAVGPTPAQVAAADHAEALARSAAAEQMRVDRARVAVDQAARLALDRADATREQASAAAVGADRLAALDAATGALRSLLDELQPEAAAGVRGGASATAEAEVPAGASDTPAAMAPATPAGPPSVAPAPTPAADSAGSSATAAATDARPAPPEIAAADSSFAVTTPLTAPDPVADQAGILDVAATAVDQVRAALPATLDVDDATAAVLAAVDQLAQTVADVSGDVAVSRATAALAQTEEEAARARAEAVAAGARGRAARLAKDAHSLDAYPNGQVPVAALCSPAFDLRVHLRCDAAELLDSLDRAYRAQFGTDLQVTDSYRSLDAQV